MKKYRKYLVRMICLEIFAILLSGCGKEEKNQSVSDTQTMEDEVVGSDIELQKPYAMHALFEDAGENNEMKGFCLADNLLYYYTINYDSQRKTHIQDLYVQERGEEAQLLLRFGEEDERRLVEIALGDESSLYLLYENGSDTEEQTYTMEKWDRELQVIWSTDTTVGMADIGSYLYDMEVGADGSIYGVTLEGIVLCWDETGSYQGRFTLPENGTMAKAGFIDTDFYYVPFGLVNAGSAGVYAYWGGADRETSYNVHLYDLGAWREMDEAERETAEPLRADYTSVDERLLPATIDTLYVFSGYEDGLYIGDKYRLWRIDTTDGSLELITVWQDVSLTPWYVKEIRRQENGDFLLYVFDTLEKWNYWVALEPVSELPEKRKLVLGVASGPAGSQSLTSKIEQVVLSYNRTHPYCQITIKKYMQSELTNFQTELVTGNGPDILLEMESFFDMETLVGKGIVEDLTPYLAEAGEEILPGILELATKNEKIPRIPLSFSVDVMILQEGMAQEVMAPQEIVDFMADSTYIDMLVSPYFLTEILSGAEMDHYVYKEEKNCFFDSEEFVDLLESLAKLKDKERIDSRQQRAELFRSGQLNVVVEELSCLKDYLCIREAFSGVGEIAGFPNSSGELRYPAKLYDWMGINSATEYKEDAWSFIEFCLSYMSRSDDVEDRFVVTKDKFYRQTSFEQPVSYFINWNHFDENWIGWQEIEAMTQEETDLLWEISEHLYFYEDDDLRAVISEDAGAFFSGYISSQEAAERIQNRANLIVNE